MKITLVEVRNFMRIVEATAIINPDGTLTTVGGRNKQGKSSFLTAILSALVGTPNSVKQAIHDDALSGEITLKVEGTDETIIIRRSFVKEGDKESTKLSCTVNGIKVSSPTEVLKTIIGQFFVDPVKFITMQPIEQRKALAALVKLDLTDVDAEIKDLRAENAERLKQQESLKRHSETLPWHEGAPEAEVSITDLTRQLVDAQANNQSNAAIVAERLRYQQKVETAGLRITELEQEIARIRANIVEIDALRQALPQPCADIDVTPLQAQIETAEETNGKVRDNQTRIVSRQKWADAEAELKIALEREQSLVLQRKTMLAAVEFPVPGLGFDETEVTFNGLPFSQASQAEQIHASVAIALAGSGKYKPIFIKDASLMDADFLKQLAEVAQKYDAQVFAEIVANLTPGGGYDRVCDLYFEDGEIVGIPVKEEDQPALIAGGSI